MQGMKICKLASINNFHHTANRNVYKTNKEGYNFD